MHVILYFKAVFCGLVIAAPVGPVGVLCVKRTLRDGFRWGLVSGFGAAVADTMFGLVAAFGLHLVADLLLEHSRMLRTVGGLLMIGVGLRELLTPPRRFDRDERRPASVNDVAGRFGSTFALTVTNPIAILSFGAVFAVAGAVVPEGDLSGAWTLVLGVFSGSMLWFTSLCGFAKLFRRWIDLTAMRVVSRVAGVVVLLLGVLVLLSLLGFADRYVTL